jgi:hypothetical protein
LAASKYAHTASVIPSSLNMMTLAESFTMLAMTALSGSRVARSLEKVRMLTASAPAIGSARMSRSLQRNA